MDKIERIISSDLDETIVKQIARDILLESGIDGLQNTFIIFKNEWLKRYEWNLEQEFRYVIVEKYWFVHVLEKEFLKDLYINQK